MALPSVWQGDVNAASLVKVPSSAPEMYIELWWYSGAFSHPSPVSSAGTLIGRGIVTSGYSYNQTPAQLHTLNPNWTATTQFAFEATLSGSNGYAIYAALWDCTLNAIVSASQISLSTGATTVIRSSKFTLTPGHIYGVTLWAANTSYGMNITDASLIVFP